jgi:prepilin-type N-terminal cleavage/methylation domain-containing protein
MILKQKTKSFTLIELLVVIAIIGLLSSIVLVSTQGSRAKARIAKGLEFSQTIQNTIGSEAVGIWDFDNCTASDASGYGNNGTINGAICSSDTPYSTAGQGAGGKNSLSFDGVDDYVDLLSSESLRLGNKGTITSWVKASSFPKDYNIIYTSTGVPDVDKAPYISCNSGGKLSARLGGAVLQNIASDLYLSAGQWYFIVFEWDGSNVSLYANMDFYTTPQTVTNQFTGDFRIGRYVPTSPERIWTGLIDDVRVYNQALSSSQIQQLYAEGLRKYKDLAIFINN